MLSKHQAVFSLLPLPAPAPPAPAGGGARRVPVRRAGRDVDLSVLDLAASLGGQLLDLLLRLQIEHDVSQLLLQLGDDGVLTVSCRKIKTHNATQLQHQQVKN